MLLNEVSERFVDRGARLRAEAKTIVTEFMRATPSCQSGREGMRLSPMLAECGFDWGNYPKATSSNQQYWVVALMRELEAEGHVEQVHPSGPWRLR